MSSAISIETLGKKYLLRHEDRLNFPTLRDAVTDRARRLLLPAARRQGATREEFWALRELSLEIGQGERVAIIGRNGAGKSTLLKILSRITEPSTGRATVRGRLASLLEVGTGFHPELTGRENIFLNGAILGMSRGEILRKFDEIVAFADVERFIDTPVKRYSSGMYVRLAFAVAAHLEPEVLVVDEVLSVGDAQFQAKCLGKMKEVGSEGRTVLFVSHNMFAVRSLCDRGVLLENGTMVETGPVGEVIDSYYRRNRNAEPTVRFADDSATDGVSLLEASVTDASGCNRNLFYLGDDIHFKVKLRRSAPVAPQAMAINICTSDGLLISNVHSADAGFVFDVAKSEECLDVRVEKVRYYPGEYSVTLVMKLPDGRHVFKSDCLCFSVLQDTEIIKRPLVREHGMFHLDSHWTHVC